MAETELLAKQLIEIIKELSPQSFRLTQEGLEFTDNSTGRTGVDPTAAFQQVVSTRPIKG